MLTPREIQLVNETWKIITPVSQQMGEEFYNLLFEAHPHLQPMFKSNKKDQAMKLMFMLSYLVIRLENIDELKSEIKKLAERHKNYGTTSDHYNAMAGILIKSLKNNVGKSWTSESEAAWYKAYNLIANLMIEAVGETNQN